jgi:DNA-binding XRE family transcriptional regulator
MFDSVLKISDVKLKIGEMTKVLRKKNKLSRQQLADLLDVSRMTIQNLEAGKNCTLDTCSRYCSTLMKWKPSICTSKKEGSN